jgi:hypothetical protein
VVQFSLLLFCDINAGDKLFLITHKMSDLVKEKLSNLEKELEKNKASNENDVNSNQRKTNEIKANEVVDKEK